MLTPGDILIAAWLAWFHAGVTLASQPRGEAAPLAGARLYRRRLVPDVCHPGAATPQTGGRLRPRRSPLPRSREWVPDRRVVGAGASGPVDRRFDLVNQERRRRRCRFAFDRQRRWSKLGVAGGLVQSRDGSGADLPGQSAARHSRGLRGPRRPRGRRGGAVRGKAAL